MKRRNVDFLFNKAADATWKNVMANLEKFIKEKLVAKLIISPQTKSMPKDMNITKLTIPNKQKHSNMINSIFLLLVTINLFSKPLEQKKNSKSEITMQSSIAKIYYNRLEVSTRLPYFTNKFIDQKAKERSEVPFKLWQTIKNSLDYTPFKNAAIQVLNNNFTTTQMQKQ